MEREHQKEKQKLVKDKDAGSLASFSLSQIITDIISNVAKGQLTKANQTKVKMENLARELQKVSHVLSVGADATYVSDRITSG